MLSMRVAVLSVILVGLVTNGKNDDAYILCYKIIYIITVMYFEIKVTNNVHIFFSCLNILKFGLNSRPIN